ncbi:MAG: hypothetical protein JST51_03165 [Armatimonadetes bacterium]|nr:hypothetical protein [Armatimonadota bacterium]
MISNSAFEAETLVLRGTVFFIQDSKELVKALSFCWEPKKEKKLVGMVHVTARSLYPASVHKVDKMTFFLYNQILCDYKNFARGDTPVPTVQEEDFCRGDIGDSTKQLVLESKIVACIKILDQLHSGQDVIEIIKMRPRYSLAHKFMKTWLYAVWDGRISPDDETEILRRNLAIREFNEFVKQGKNYKSVEYIPLVKPPL